MRSIKKYEGDALNKAEVAKVKRNGKTIVLQEILEIRRLNLLRNINIMNAKGIYLRQAPGNPSILVKVFIDEWWVKANKE